MSEALRLLPWFGCSIGMRDNLAFCRWSAVGAWYKVIGIGKSSDLQWGRDEDVVF